MYVLLYSVSQGLNVVTTALMCKRALQLGVIHIHQLFLRPTGTTLTPHWTEEVAIIKIMNNTTKLKFIRVLDIIFWKDGTTISRRFSNHCDIILQTICQTHIYMGDILLIFTIDHMQNKPITGNLFLISSNVISCYIMINLKRFFQS